MEFDCLQPATKQGSEYLTYVLWAITPEGRTANLGEILLNGTTRAAVEKGIVPGGGVALLRASVALQALRLEGDEQFGVTIVHRACEEPVRQIVVNCGTEGAIVVEKIKTSEDPNLGFNAATEQ